MQQGKKQINKHPTTLNQKEEEKIEEEKEEHKQTSKQMQNLTKSSATKNTINKQTKMQHMCTTHALCNTVYYYKRIYFHILVAFKNVL